MPFSHVRTKGGTGLRGECSRTRCGSLSVRRAIFSLWKLVIFSPVH